MIKIQCEKCKCESSNPYNFGQKRFGYINQDNYSQTCHLCTDCQTNLTNQLMQTTADFLAEPAVRDWNESKGII